MSLKQSDHSLHRGCQSGLRAGSLWLQTDSDVRTKNRLGDKDITVVMGLIIAAMSLPYRYRRWRKINLTQKGMRVFSSLIYMNYFWWIGLMYRLVFQFKIIFLVQSLVCWQLWLTSRGTPKCLCWPTYQRVLQGNEACRGFDTRRRVHSQVRNTTSVFLTFSLGVIMDFCFENKLK